MTDIIERLRAAVPTYEGTPIAWSCKVPSELLLEAAAEVERLREGLHRVSLASQNSMSSKDECGRIAREALEVKP